MRYTPGLSAPTPNVTRLLIVLIATYLAFAIFGRTMTGASIYQSMVLYPDRAIFSYELWRLLSYSVLHDVSSPMHIIFNGLMLYMMGTPVEEKWGEKRFLIFVVIAIVLGGLLVSLSYLLGISHGGVVGFSAATVGLVIAWGLLFPEQQIFILGIVPLSGKHLVYVTVGLEILYAVSSNSISSAAHFGGIIAGFIFSLGIYKPRRIMRRGF